MKNIAKSVRQKLLNISRENKIDYMKILIRYAIERFLYRLGISEYKNKFVLKGAMLFIIWTENPHRTTKDLDLQLIENISRNEIMKILKSVCEMKVEPDGLLFDTKSILMQEIREHNTYIGYRIKMKVQLEQARIPIQIDLAYGDIITPETKYIEYPVLLNFPKPKIKAYSIEKVIAEKLEIIINKGIANSRMKDYYDLYKILNEYKFNEVKIKDIIKKIFKRRNSNIPNNVPIGLSDEFISNKDKVNQWNAFIRRNKLNNEDYHLKKVVNRIREVAIKLWQSILKELKNKN